MKKLLLVLIVMVSTLAYSQNTFYTRGLEISNKPKGQENFLVSKILEDYSAAISVKFNFSYVNIKGDDYELDLKIWQTSLHDKNNPSKGYNLYCLDSNEERCIISVSLEEQLIILFVQDNNNSVSAFTYNIKLID